MATNDSIGVRAYHRDGSVTLWDGDSREWVRTSTPTPAQLARHCYEDRVRIGCHVRRWPLRAKWTDVGDLYPVEGGTVRYQIRLHDGRLQRRLVETLYGITRHDEPEYCEPADVLR